MHFFLLTLSQALPCCCFCSSAPDLEVLNSSSERRPTHDMENNLGTHRQPTPTSPSSSSSSPSSSSSSSSSSLAFTPIIAPLQRHMRALCCFHVDHHPRGGVALAAPQYHPWIPPRFSIDALHSITLPHRHNQLHQAPPLGTGMMNFFQKLPSRLQSRMTKSSHVSVKPPHSTTWANILTACALACDGPFDECQRHAIVNCTVVCSMPR